jgi:flagellar biosynthesis/type III secretory pathway protein FliH
MTFEEWWAAKGHKALDPEEVRFQKDWYKEAYEAGWQEGYNQGYTEDRDGY